MNTGWKINSWRQQEATDDDQYLPSGKDLYKKPVQNNMPEENDEIKKQAVDIIIAPAENIKHRNQFDHNISFQVVPVRIKRAEEISPSPGIRIIKDIGKI